ncbi:hypothetical protein ABZV60_29425 [Streptomyces sp. NPDC004787]|uniref:hypothetical protein n=1 Tax=Streptomyces sp. NPDC004787 TaxID=3154291 RepID=UPI0033AC5076
MSKFKLWTASAGLGIFSIAIASIAAPEDAPNIDDLAGVIMEDATSNHRDLAGVILEDIMELPELS